MYLIKTPSIVKRVLPKYIWNASSEGIYLTFDDGPIPEITPWILDTLKEFEAKATFFCVGQNVEKHNKIYKRILDEGHTVGNHTQNHLSAWQENATQYLDNVDLASKNIKSSLFRPPYGKLTPKTTKALINRGFQIVMWDILSGDFDEKLSKEDCLNNCKKHLNPGSIIVFHDNIKSIEKVKYVLPKLLSHIKECALICKQIKLSEPTI